MDHGASLTRVQIKLIEDMLLIADDDTISYIEYETEASVIDKKRAVFWSMEK